MFRTGLDDPALLNALMLAFAFGAGTGTIDEECLYYKGQAIHFLRQRMNAPISGATEPTLGAILLIAGVEVRAGPSYAGFGQRDANHGYAPNRLAWVCAHRSRST